MSQICPTSSHQLLAASLAFHCARRKFIQNSSQRIQSEHKEPKSIQASNGLTRPRTVGYWYKGNRKSRGTSDAKSDDSIGDGELNATFRNGRKLDERNFKVFNRLNYESTNNNEDCFYHHDKCEKRANVKCQISDDSIDLFSDDERAQLSVSKKDDRLYDFPQKLYEWECRTCQEPLMKTQRFFPHHFSEMKRDIEVTETRYQSTNYNQHRGSKCHLHHKKYKFENHSPTEILSASNDFFSLKNENKHYLNNNQVFCSRCNYFHVTKNTSVTEVDRPDENNDEEDDEFKNMKIFKHKDSMIIIAEKFICNNAQYKLIEKVDSSLCKNGGNSSCEKMSDQQVSDQTTKECRIRKKDVDTETCCTRKNSPTKELRSNKLVDRLKPKCLELRLTRTKIPCTNEESSSDSNSTIKLK